MERKRLAAVLDMMRRFVQGPTPRVERKYRFGVFGEEDLCYIPGAPQGGCLRSWRGGAEVSGADVVVGRYGARGAVMDMVEAGFSEQSR